MKPFLFSKANQSLGLIIISALLMTGCWSYYTKKVALPTSSADPWPETVTNLKNSRPLIQIVNASQKMDLVNYRLEDDIIIGTLTDAKEEVILPTKGTFARKNIPKAQRQPLLMTLQLWTDQKLSSGEASFPLSEFTSAQYVRPAHGVNVLTHIGAGVVGAAVFLAIACNCPRVYALNENGEKMMQGSLFTGAISKSFERTDLLPLYRLNRTEESIHLTIANELPEDEYIDEVKLLKVKKKADTRLAVDVSGELFEYNPNLISPTSAISLDGRDIASEVALEDGQVHDFDDMSEAKELNSAIFTFNKSDLPNQTAKLIVLGRQTDMLEASAEYMFSLFGDKFDKLNEKMDKFPREKYEAQNAKRGISMNAFIKTSKGWENAGSFHYASIVNQKWLGMDIDVSKVEGENVEIKLEAAYKFWELDYVGLSNDWNTLSNYEEVPTLSAFNEKGEDVSSLIQTADQQYAVQPHAGSFIEFSFENNASEDEVYVLKGTGYYHHIRDYDHKPNKRMLVKLKSMDPLSAQEVSKTLDLYLRAVSAHP